MRGKKKRSPQTANSKGGRSQVRTEEVSPGTSLVRNCLTRSNLAILHPWTWRSRMKTAIVIPARYASSRLPGKPLLKATGKYLIQHVYERACQAKCGADVIVATDDERIRDVVAEFGGRVAMTRADHASGTDRVAEVAAGLSADVIVNLQGDEPQIEPAVLDRLAGLLGDEAGADMATLAVPI